jgi:hypothetical protein
MANKREPKLNLPKPGEVIHHDFRNSTTSQSNRKSIRFVQWNIERGYKLNNIIEILKKTDADVICLQEIDIGCERSEDKGSFCSQQLLINKILDLKSLKL